MESPLAPERGSRLALGFATAVGMWIIGYLAFMRPGVVAGEFLFALMCICVLVGGWIAARCNSQAGQGAGVRSGAFVGFVSACVNLLVVGALFGRDTQQDVWRQLAVWTGGLMGASLVLGAVGGAIGGRASRWRARMSPLSLFAMVTAVAIFLLLITGGLVTGLEAGLAVPDWPNSFGHNMLLFPLAEMKGGIYYEHAHRLYGMLVGVTALTMTCLVFRCERRWGVRALAVAGFLMVCGQGLLGALRVTGHFTLSQDAAEMTPSVPLAVVHGVFGQLVFATYCVLAVICSNSWRNAQVRPGLLSSRGRLLSQVLVGVLLLQLISGALYRHYQVPVANAPPVHPAWAMHMHLSWAVVAFVVTLWVGLRAMALGKETRPLWQLGHALLMLVGLQVAMGIGALVSVVTRVSDAIPIWEVVLTSLHQAIGALLLATGVMLALWWRCGRAA